MKKRRARVWKGWATIYKDDGELVALHVSDPGRPIFVWKKTIPVIIREAPKHRKPKRKRHVK